MKENGNKRTVTRTFRGVNVNVVIVDKPPKPKPAPEKKTKEVWFGNLFTTGMTKKTGIKQPDEGLIAAKEYLKRTFSSRQRADIRHAPIIDDHKSIVLGEELDLGDKLK
jgi:hypothetical protein